MADLQIIATVNWHLLKPEPLEALAARGATILRINGSHVQSAEIGPYTGLIRGVLGRRVKILLDLPGNKIRTAGLSQPIPAPGGKTFNLRASQINYPEFFKYLKPGDEILANDSLLRFRVESVDDQQVALYSFHDGALGSNKGMHLLGRSLPLPFLFPRDRELIKAAIANDLDLVGLSFVRAPGDVEEAWAALRGSTVKPLVKIETGSAIDHLEAILAKADDFIVDRGDLSCDVGIENIDFLQKIILRKAKQAGKRIYLATQFLHSMVEHPTPLIAEVCALSDVMRLGVDGIQFSEETAAGKHPLAVLEMAQKVRAAVRRGAPARTKGVLWLTGRSGSGKTTIARLVAAAIEAKGYACGMIDGDDYRAFWENDAGYTREQRILNQRGIIFAAHQAAAAFDFVIVSSLSPYRETRDLARKKLADFLEIYVDCPTEVCRARDPKKHYQKALAGEHKDFVGVTEDYEEPESPDVTVRTDDLSPRQAAEIIQKRLFPEA